MKRSAERILTTHVGSLVRPPGLVEIMRAKESGQPYDQQGLAAQVRRSVTEVVQRQVEAGVDIVSDGEYGKPSFSGYVNERLTGFERRPRNPQESQLLNWGRDRKLFREFYEEYDRATGSAAGYPVVCTGPIADAMREEYSAIVRAGFLLQIDDPRVVTQYGMPDPAPSIEEYRRFAELRVEAINHALADIPPDRVRYHLCWGSWHGPHVTDVPLKDIGDIVLRVRAGAYCVEAANPRHEHEWQVWEDVKLPDGKILIPGVVTHSTNIIEHPDLVAWRIENFARL